jgi:hypothetical protein
MIYKLLVVFWMLNSNIRHTNCVFLLQDTIHLLRKVPREVTVETDRFC